MGLLRATGPIDLASADGVICSRDGKGQWLKIFAANIDRQKKWMRCILSLDLLCGTEVS